MLSEIQATQTASPDLAALRQRIHDATARPEQEVILELMEQARMDPPTLAKAQALAAQLAQGVRDARIDAGGVDLLTQEFSLDSREGIALMCLAEAMLRIPDTETRNQLIRDKIVDADWRAHLGKSPSLFVNATAWGLLVTGKLLKQPDENALAEALSRVVRKGGEAVVRAGVAYAMRMLGKQFVTGQTIEEAIGVAKGREATGYRYSYDMLGEAALTDEDAQAYFESYRHAIEAIGKDAQARGPIDGPGVSVKISGLHPRYELMQRDRVLVELYPRLLELARLAKHYGIGFHLDQEESARFDLTLEMLERLSREPSLAGWNGIGISLQSYQKRGRAVADWIIALARATGRRFNIRLVKGAYWDTEIKLAQDAGAAGYPVFTRKVHSDVSYIACAKVLLAAPDAIFPQFATHNAFSIAAVHTLAGGQEYEFQCLHGMGETVYDQVVGPSKLKRACRIYAPVGPHATLLAYLVRRLLENGANSSFVNQIVDPAVSIADIVEDPVARAARTGGKPHGGIVTPGAVLPGRVNAKALSYGNAREFQDAVASLRATRPAAQSIVASGNPRAADATRLVYGAGDTTDVIGSVSDSEPSAVPEVLAAASFAASAWSRTPALERAATLERATDAIQSASARIGALLVLENGMTLAEAAEEVRSAINVCRLYAYQIKTDTRLDTTEPLGVVVGLSPVSSPMFALVEQISSSLAAGNAVIAKPSTGASLVAGEVVGAFHRSGVPIGALQLVLGAGETVGRTLVSDERVAAVLFAGSVESAQAVSTELAALARPPRLLGAVGGVNAMVVDSSALPEQVISDAITSAFKRAGQGAASLRLLCLQDSTADKVLRMLKGMLSERVTGSPLSVASDIGPVATRSVRDRVEAYIGQLQRKGFEVTRGTLPAHCAKGHFVAPTIVDLGALDSLAAFDGTVVGPVLHVVRFKTGDMDSLLARLNDLGCAVLGLHTRINEAAGKLLSRSTANAVCVNRAMHSPFPGMQPFGGIGLCGAVPMSGGPLTLFALTRTIAPSFNASNGPFASTPGVVSEKFYEFPVESADGKSFSRRDAMTRAREAARRNIDALYDLAMTLHADHSFKVEIANHRQRLTTLIERLDPISLPALTGEENTVELLPRGRVLCAGESAVDVVVQAMAACAFGNEVILVETQFAKDIAGKLGKSCRIARSADAADIIRGEDVQARPDAVMVTRKQNGTSNLRATAMQSKLCCIEETVNGGYDWPQLVRERITTVNASAAGGNTQLMVLSEDAL
ncbi:bifunctional proline dehydrogenase/L-glutamate gamma-semialdehyde dehydrogenase PutA [Trinickia dinghuensis]|uniref:Bifunctional protein PutA n=1 Tax=Trinickia dinghuensis TaxID=2291023 RepID=A0A3D8K4V6_9BURK|nr:bifunctional proline dehydrogenase/L-glutamate gamma-semialdehyde dehydrogenase PutA [Trinickia dinghuensis]RDV00250.1 bifunctional proline dehydrogenase/L-glutamate gamma-semialdehyde dehydrogenase PutA [Trinickia dinghuensis]